MSDCVIWDGAVMGTGYGTLRVDGATRLAHRHAYEQAYGRIPDGLQIDHLCRVRLCVNPAHLEAVTQQENIRRQFAAYQQQDPATHCRAGHAWTPANTRIGYQRGRPKRICRACMRGYQQAYRARLAPAEVAGA